MEEPVVKETLEDKFCSNSKINEECISTNWRLPQSHKKLSDSVSIITSSKAPKSLTLEDVVDDDSYIILEPKNANNSEHEACTVEIKLPKSQKISRICVVSEASVLEFFHENGEYSGTEFAEFIDEFEGSSVYLAELVFQRPTSHASIKFTRIHNNSRSNMYLYGMKLVIEESTEGRKSLKGGIFEKFLMNTGDRNFGPELNMIIPDSNVPFYDGKFPGGMDAELGNLMTAFLEKKRKPSKTEPQVAAPKPLENNNIVPDDTQKSIELYISEQFKEMERRLTQRIDDAQAKTTEKLDFIIKHLELLRNSS